MSEIWLSKFHPPLAGGIVNAFEAVTVELWKISLLSEAKDNYDAQYSDIPEKIKTAIKKLESINEDSTRENYVYFIDFIKNISEDQWTILEKLGKNETATTNFHTHFRKLSGLVEDKLSVPLPLWKQAKKDEINFPEEYDKLENELQSVRREVENARILRDKVMPEQAAKGEKMRRKIAAAKDFKSQHPFFVIANAEEHLEFLVKFNEKKLEMRQERKNMAKMDFTSVTMKLRNEVRRIIEETVRTKAFADWLREKYEERLEEYKVEKGELWRKFSSEMEESRYLGKKYADLNSIYNKINQEKLEKEYLVQRESAATTLQAYWRGHMVRRKFQAIE